MSRVRLGIAIVLTAVVSAVATYSALRLTQSEQRPGGQPIALRSAILGEDREYVVSLPPGYADTSARFPVLYVLDAGTQFASMVESTSTLARTGVIPPMIVVGIINRDQSTRGRDFTPPARWTTAAPNATDGATRFLSFMEKELIPRIETDFRTSRPRVIAGWSLSGLFVLYSQIASPLLFDARFAHSPAFWEENDPSVGRFTVGLQGMRPASGFLYVSQGGAEDQRAKAPFTQAMKALESRPPSALRTRVEISPGGLHDTDPRLSAPVALCTTFSATTGHSCKPLPR